jgi:PAS domain S-box-containing protein
MTDILQTVLLVDDCQEDRITYHRYLLQDRHHSYQILEAKTGQEALLLCQQQSPDVILLDYRLPDLDGVEFLNKLKTYPARANLTVIMLTAQGNEQIAVRAMKSGAAEYLSKKNLTPDTLRVAIQNVLEKKAALIACQQAEETLQIHTTELEELYHRAPCGYHSLDTEANFIRINDTELNMLGYSREELVDKKKFSDLLTPKSLAIFLENFPRFKQQGWVKDLEFEMICKDGRILPISLSATAVRDTAGNYLYSRSVVIDISDRKRTEEELRQARDELEIRVTERTAELVRANTQLQQREAFLSSIYNGAEQAIFVVDVTEEGEFYYVNFNQVSERYADVTNDQIRGKTPEQAFGKELGSSLRRNYNRCLQAGTSIRYEEKLVFDGHTIWTLTTLSPIWNERGRIYRIVGTAVDISDRKDAEEKISEQAALLDIASDAIFVRDLEHHILFWNSGAERLYGWTTAEVFGKKTNQFLCQKILLQIEEAIKTVLEVGSWRGELQKSTKSGKEVIVNSRMTLVRDRSGNPKSILTVDTDITEKKQLEAQFYQAQRLESLGTLASGIAHDMNNILTPILAAAQLLPLQNFNLNSKNQRLLEILTDNAKRGAELVKQILSFARKEEEELVLLQPKYSIEETERIIKEVFPKSIEIKTDIPKQDLWTISANPTQISQVLMNLCVNARDAMPHGGILTISAKNFSIDENYTRMNLDVKIGDYVIITVSDTGCGMSQEVKERIFEPFFTTKESGKGTGLGLSTAIGIVKIHGGFVKVHSEVGKGSQFQVCFPASETVVTREDFDSQIVRGSGELILVVDDESSIREITQTSLASYNYRVFTAGDAIEAFSIYAQYKDKIRIVLMDIQMPSLSGINAIRILRQMNPSIKIIAISGLDSNRRLLEDSGTEVQAFLSKPYTINQLLDTIRNVLERSTLS